MYPGHTNVLDAGFPSVPKESRRLDPFVKGHLLEKEGLLLKTGLELLNDPAAQPLRAVGLQNDTFIDQISTSFAARLIHEAHSVRVGNMPPGESENCAFRQRRIVVRHSGAFKSSESV